MAISEDVELLISELSTSLIPPQRREIRGRERNGLIELTPPPSLRRGARVRILRGPFCGHLAIYVEILLQLLGGEQRVTLSKGDVAAV